MQNEHELEVVNVRLVREPSLYSETPLNTPQAITELMADELSKYDREVMCVLNMKTNGQCINMNIASMGAINHTLISPREIFKSAILANASHVILLHNHPSGSVQPSHEDLVVTEQLEKCGQLLGIPVRDHVIIGGTNKKMYSFAENRQLEGKKESPNITQEKKLNQKNNRQISQLQL
ncbi:JAB domain-containing protein [Muricomes intestini]|mgnify:CR=1 FL=1|jgi:DNA repair protein RadC|uniref:JAB domain-containing protein n=3 Tax=Muricomes intestini TaxID=1796634 RepID=UPI000E7F4C1F|nr:hypothetical protein [Lachnospiraceae bacterium]